MGMQNVTLAIPKHILHEAKLLAVKRRISLSALLTQLLSEMVAEESGYLGAQRRHLANLERGFDLGTNGMIGWKREDLHER